MKEIFAFAIGLTFFSWAQACDWDRQDCSNEILGRAKPKLDWLRQNPDFMQKHWAEIQNKSANTDANVKYCKTMRCINQTYNDFAGRIEWYYMEYTKKPAQQPAQKTPADKWAEQCVVAAKPNVAAYSDMAATTKNGSVSEYTGYKVSQTNGSQYVGLTNSQDGKFVGWVKKSDLQMQDLRNCN